MRGRAHCADVRAFRLSRRLAGESESLDFDASGDSIGDRIQVVLIASENRTAQTMGDGDYVDIRIDRDGKFGRWLSSRHTGSLLPR